jgi:hypothetical protein
MKILSFDVGIKNLAYCLIESTDATESTEATYTIDAWGILTISPEPVCSHQLPSRQCENTAKFLVGETHLCPSHRKLKSYREAKAKKIPKLPNSVFEHGKNIARRFDAHPEFLTVDAVLIENQPALKNPTMKSIQMMVYMYFLVKGVNLCQTDTTESLTIKTIEMINARNKLKAYKGPPIPCDITDRYKKTKYLGVESCKRMIDENSAIANKWRSLFTHSKKQDDLADAYLQGMYWLTK